MTHSPANLSMLKARMHTASEELAKAEKEYLAASGTYHLAYHGVSLGDIVLAHDGKRGVVVGADYFPLMKPVMRNGDLGGELIELLEVEDARVVGRWYKADSIVPVWASK